MSKDTFTREEVLELLDSIHRHIGKNYIKVYDYDENEMSDKKWWLYLSSPHAHKLSHDELLTTLTRKLKAT